MRGMIEIHQSDQILTMEKSDITFRFNDTKDAPLLINEIFSDNYCVLENQGKIEFQPGDVVLDIGANEGMFSIMISKFFPETRIIAFEPVPQTYTKMMQNILLNGCLNIECYNVGIGKPGQSAITLNVSKDYSSGSTALCTFIPTDHDRVPVTLISLDDVFDVYKISRCKLLKMDIEGMEYDVLYNCQVLPRVDYMTAEFHINANLEYQSMRADGLVNWVSNQTNLIYVDICKMAE